MYSEVRIAEQEAKKEQRISASNRSKSGKKTKAYGLGGAFDN